MKLLIAIAILVAIAVGTEGVPGFRDTWYKAKRFGKEAQLGTGDMYRAYRDLDEANWIDADKFFHARGNYDAAQRGPGGVWAATVISNGKELFDWLRGKGADSAADQEANLWGRNGGDPEKYRPPGLPLKYKSRFS